jgi:uncharacterized protein (TIGR03067 family)
MKPQLFLVLAVSALIAADTANDDVKKELKKFEGTWVIESFEQDGEKTPADAFKGTKLVCKDDTFTMTMPGVTYKGTFKVDVAKKPKHIDIHFTEGPEKGKNIKGIYEIEGDTYKLCIKMMGDKDRPTEFATKAGSGIALEVLKREKSK